VELIAARMADVSSGPSERFGRLVAEVLLRLPDGEAFFVSRHAPAWHFSGVPLRTRHTLDVLNSFEACRNRDLRRYF
jgi:hypothetical protein